MPERAIAQAFRRAVLGLNGGPTDALVVDLACALGRPHKAELIALHIVEVDWTRDLADDIASGNETASAILDHAEGIAERQNVPLRTELIQARDVGAALVDEATELGADMMLVGLPYRKKFGGDFMIGKTVPYVLQNAPFGVIVVREPIATGEGRGANTPILTAAGTRDRQRR
ncbi:MAG: universal stress protein [Chloroflexi bacterium]|nr:universal stress protein [Chloroflexota bacterium]